MGLLGLAALIPAFKGDILTSAVMLGADYLFDSQERKDRENPQIRTITEMDWCPIFRWSLGKEFFLLLTDLMKQEKPEAYEVKNAIIERWNDKRGNSLWLYDYEPFEHNFMRMAQKWVNAGCPN